MAHIITHEDTTGYAPVDERWCAYEDNYDGTQPIGKGATEDAAISDLEEQLDDADEAAEAARRAACGLCKGTGWITVRTTGAMSYVGAGEPPDYATGVIGIRCDQCGGQAP
jgi:hypothetical protein